MPYTDPQTVNNPTAGQPFPAAWGDIVRADLEFLIDPPACSVFNSAAVSIADVTLVKMLANSENYDNDSMHSTSSNTSRITATTAGRYLALACVVFDPNTGGERLVDFLVNNVTQYVGLAVGANPAGARNTGLTVTRTMVLAAGDYVEVRTRQSSGGALNAQLYEFSLLFATR